MASDKQTYTTIVDTGSSIPVDDLSYSRIDIPENQIEISLAEFGLFVEKGMINNFVTITVNIGLCPLYQKSDILDNNVIFRVRRRNTTNNSHQSTPGTIIYETQKINSYLNQHLHIRISFTDGETNEIIPPGHYAYTLIVYKIAPIKQLVPLCFCPIEFHGTSYITNC